MKKALLLWAIFIVTGTYNVRYPHTIGLRTDRHFSIRVQAENKAHAANSVLTVLKCPTRHCFSITEVKRVK